MHVHGEALEQLHYLPLFPLRCIRYFYKQTIIEADAEGILGTRKTQFIVYLCPEIVCCSSQAEI